MCAFSPWLNTTKVSILLSVILLLRFGVDVEAHRKWNQNYSRPSSKSVEAETEIPVSICSTKMWEKSDLKPDMRREDEHVLNCNSTEPINWIKRPRPSAYPWRAKKNEIELKFEIETKLVACGNGQVPLSLSPPAPNATIPFYFTSTFTLIKAGQWSTNYDMEFDIFCGSFLRHRNSTNFPRACIKVLRNGTFSSCAERKPTPPDSQPSTSANPSECGDVILKFDNSTNSCGCESGNEGIKALTLPGVLPCKNLMSCRLLAEAKSEQKRMCEARSLENWCDVPSFFPVDHNKTKGGLLFCPLARSAENTSVRVPDPYVLFFAISQQPQQQPDSASLTSDTTEPNLNKSQILGNDPENYGRFLTIVLHDINEHKEPWRNPVDVECKGPAFLFLQGFLWSFEVNTNESESYSLPNFTILDSNIGNGNSSAGEKDYWISKVRIPRQRWNPISSLNVTCAAALTDRNQFVQSSLIVTVYVYKAEIKGQITCPQGKLLQYHCETEKNVNWTWHAENGKAYEMDDRPEERSFLKCPNETITCTAILPSGVKTSYQFPPANCSKFVKKHNNCTLEDGKDKDKGSLEIIIGIAGGLGMLLLIFIPCVVILLRKIKTQKERLKFSDEAVEDFLRGNDSVHFIPYDTSLEIPRDQIKIGTKLLGSGAFGKVVEGEFRDRKVAIKTVNKSADIQFFKALLSEIKIMGFVGKHENILELVGACTWDIKKRNVYVVFELCENGNLVQFLRSNRDNFENQNQLEKQRDAKNTIVRAEKYGLLPVDTAEIKWNPFDSYCILAFISAANGMTKSESISMLFGMKTSQYTHKITGQDLVRWSFEIASGMDVIAQKNIYHGDLAARNILLDENLVAKVGDFGLSRQLFEYSVYVQKKGCPLPLKWMSIESLRDLEFSIQSDVWSFGITLWEIFSLGCQPYPNSVWNFTSWKRLLDGERMEKPDYASTPIYEMMLKCWNEKPSDRPTFAHLKTILEEEYRKFK